jgi:hypothetical protein
MATKTAVATVVATGTLTNAKVTIASESFDEYKKLKAEIASRQREVEQIVEQWETANNLPVASATTAGEYVIVNGNAQEIGKVTVSWREPEKKPRAGFWTRRIS